MFQKNGLNFNALRTVSLPLKEKKKELEQKKKKNRRDDGKKFVPIPSSTSLLLTVVCCSENCELVALKSEYDLCFPPFFFPLCHCVLVGVRFMFDP